MSLSNHSDSICTQFRIFFFSLCDYVEPLIIQHLPLLLLCFNVWLKCGSWSPEIRESSISGLVQVLEAAGSSVGRSIQAETQPNLLIPCCNVKPTNSTEKQIRLGLVYYKAENRRKFRT